MQVTGLQTGIGHCLTDGLHGALYQIGSQLVELCPGQGDVQVLGAGSIGSNIRQVDGGGGHTGQLDLSLLSSLSQALHSHLVLGQVYTLRLLKLGYQVIHHSLIEVVAAQHGVAVCCQHFHDAVANFQNGNVERTAAQVIDHDLLLIFLIQAISQRSRSGLVDNSLHVQTGDLTGVLGCLTLCVGEVCRHGNNRFGNGLSQICLCIGLQLLQNHCADLLRSVALAVHRHTIVFTHMTLDGCDGAVCVGHSLTLCHLTDHSLTGLGKCHHRGGGSAAFGVGDYNRFAAFQYSHTGVGCTQINTNNFSHNKIPPKNIIYTFIKSVRYLHHCKADDFFTQFKALLEHLCDGVFSSGIILGMHHCIVNIGVKCIPCFTEDLYAQAV